MEYIKKTIPSLDVKKLRPMSEVIRRAKKDGKTIHFANLMDVCHLKSAELAKHFHKCKERVVLWEDNVQDEEGYRAVFSRVRCSSVSEGSGKILGHHLKASWYGWRKM